MRGPEVFAGRKRFPIRGGLGDFLNCFLSETGSPEKASLKIDNKNIERGKSFRYGFRNSIEGTDLIVWIEKESAGSIKISFKPGRE